MYAVVVACQCQLAPETSETFKSSFASVRDDILSSMNPTDLLLTKLLERRLLSQQQVDDIKVGLTKTHTFYTNLETGVSAPSHTDSELKCK